MTQLTLPQDKKQARKTSILLAERVMAVLLGPLLLRVRFAPDEAGRRIEFHLCSELLSNWPFRIGMLARRIFYQKTLAYCGNNPVIRLGTIFIYPQAELGNNIFMGNRCTIGLASFGDNVLLGHNVSVLSGRHHHHRAANNQVMEDGSIKRIVIERGAWLGAGSIIMADVGEGAIVGAGAVVVRPVSSGTTVVGNPARTL